MNTTPTEPTITLNRCDGLFQRVAIVVEDDFDCQAAMRIMLVDLGYRVWVAGDALEAFDCYREVKYVDLAIVDLMLPILSGAKLISSLTQVDPELPIIATTGGSFLTTRLRSARIRGAVTVLPKPFGRAEFVQAVRRAAR